MRPVPVSINNGNEFIERCESGRLVVSFKKDNIIETNSSCCKAIHTKGELVLEGIHGCLLVNRTNGEWNLEYKQND
jgi:hypothetical protein